MGTLGGPHVCEVGKFFKIMGGRVSDFGQFTDRSGTRNGRTGGFYDSPTINIARVVPHGRQSSMRSD